MLAEELTLESIKEAMLKGRMFWVSNMDREHEPPTVTNIDFSDDGIVVTVDGFYRQVRWIYNRQIIHIGNSFSFTDNMIDGQNYVRFEIWSKPGDFVNSSIVGSQPFGLTRRER